MVGRRPASLASAGLRMRLTVLYGGLFFVAGSVLLWFTYLLTARALNQRFRLVIASA